MKAIITIVNDYDEVVIKDKIINPEDEYIITNPKDITTTKTSVF